MEDKTGYYVYYAGFNHWYKCKSYRQALTFSKAGMIVEYRKGV